MLGFGLALKFKKMVLGDSTSQVKEESKDADDNPVF